MQPANPGGQYAAKFAKVTRQVRDLADTACRPEG